MKRICIFMLCLTLLPLARAVANEPAGSIQKEPMEVHVERFRSQTGFSCWSYVLSGEKGTVMVDPGAYEEALCARLKALGGVDAILLTHGHWDHTRALDRVLEEYPHTPVYINDLESAFLTDPQLNCSASGGFVLQIKAEVTLLAEGQHSIGGYTVQMIHTPGHTVGSSIYYFPQAHVLFAGDSIGYTTTFRPTGCAEAMQHTIKKLAAIPFPGDTRVYFGHEDFPFRWKDLLDGNLLKTDEPLPKALAIKEEYR